MDAAAIRQHYQNVKDTIDSAMESTEGLDVKGEDENKFLDEARKQIGKINDDFKKEIDALEQSSEWDKFCIAFFGETNAGKSTLIDTLRICYDEQSRIESILSNKKECNDLLERNSAEIGKVTKALEDLRHMASQATEQINKNSAEMEKNAKALEDSRRMIYKTNKKVKTLQTCAVITFLFGLLGSVLSILMLIFFKLWG